MEPNWNRRKTALLAAAAALLAADLLAESCLWKVSSDTGTLYLQGSVHVLRAANHPLDAAIDQAYAASDELVFEADLAAMLAPETRQMVLAKAMLPPGESLAELLGPESHRMFAAECAKAGMPAAALDPFKPWFAATTLAMVRMQALGFDPELGVDRHLHARSVADGKPSTGLETVGFQVDLLDALSEDDPPAFVARTLKDLEMLETKVDELLAAWTEGDIEAVGELMAESFKDHPGLYDRFIAARNRDWAEKLAGMLREPRVRMVVVGAAHLPGEDGLLELLRKRGYALEPL